MAKHTITISLSNEQEKFIEWLRKYDNETTDIDYTSEQELGMIFQCGLKETMNYFKEDFNHEG